MTETASVRVTTGTSLVSPQATHADRPEATFAIRRGVGLAQRPLGSSSSRTALKHPHEVSKPGVAQFRRLFRAVNRGVELGIPPRLLDPLSHAVSAWGERTTAFYALGYVQCVTSADPRDTPHWPVQGGDP